MTDAHGSKAADAAPLTTYYNGGCPVCRPAVERYRREAGDDRADLAWRDVNAEPELLADRGLDLKAAKMRLHVVDRTGALRSGVDAFIALWAEIPRRRPMARLLSVPAVHAPAAFLYDRVLAPGLYWLGRTLP